MSDVALGDGRSTSESGGAAPDFAGPGNTATGRLKRALPAIAALTVLACGPRSAPPSTETKTRALGASTAEWVELGPKPIGPGASAHGVGPNGDATSGATGNVIVHPSNSNIIYVVPQTGGIWRTKNGLDDSPQWTVLTDTLPSSSIGALAMDPGNSQVLVAGTGTYTTYGDPVKGHVYVTLDGGDDWQTLDDPLLVGKPEDPDPARFDKSIQTINVRSNRILVGTNGNGLFRRVGDLSKIGQSGQPGFVPVTGVPTDAVIRSLVADPTNPTRLFAAIPNTHWTNANTGIYRSDDDGATWKLLPTQTGGPPGNDEFRHVTQNPNITTEKLAIGSDGRLYLTVAIYIDVSWVGRSDDHGETWTAIEIPKFTRDPPMDVPINIDSIAPLTLPDGSQGVVVTSQVRFDNNWHFARLAGVSDQSLNRDFLSIPVDGQPFSFMLADLLTREPIKYTGAPSGGTWLTWYSTQNCGQWDKSALAVDPTDSTKLYISGDCQRVRWSPSDQLPPNQIPSTQWTSIQDSGTISNTQPHADSLSLAFDSQGRLLLGCDGGVFRHTNPGGMGDWQSLNTNLGTTEFYGIAIDPLSGMAFGGLQDNGTVTQEYQPGVSTAWREYWGGDGSNVLVCARPGQDSERYNNSFHVEGFNAQGARTGTSRDLEACVQRDAASKSCPDGEHLWQVDDRPLNAQSAINNAAVALDPTDVRLVFAENGAVWESTNGGADVQMLHTAPADGQAGGAVNFAYGHPKNLDALWAVSNSAVFVRLTAGGPLNKVTLPVEIHGALDEDVVMAPDKPEHAFVAASERVFATTDGGVHWDDLTGDLSHQACGTHDTARARRIYAIRYVPNSTQGDRLFIGTDRGVFMASVNNPGVWTQAGSKLPTNMAVADMDYLATGTGPNAGSDFLVAAIYGRGAWRLPSASKLNQAPMMPSFHMRNEFGVCVASIDIPADTSCKGTLSPSDFGSGAVDPDGDPVTLSVDSPGPYLQGSQCVTLSASDNRGASATCKVDVRVLDQTPPVITRPADITTTTCGALTLAKPIVSDACGVQTVTSNAPASFPLGTTTVTWTATDTSGNAATPVTQKVTVGGPPTFTQKPTDKSYTLCDTPPGIGTAKAVDVCGAPVSVTNNAPAVFPVGTTAVTWTAVDAMGNTATFTQTITVSGATDLQAEHSISTVKNNACLQVTKYPTWGAYLHSVIVQPQATGVGWPIPFTFSNCGTNSGSGSLPGPWQQATIRPVSTSCTTYIKLGANGAGSVTLTWWGNG